MWPLRNAHRYEVISTQPPSSVPIPHDNREKERPTWRLWAGRIIIAVLVLLGATIVVRGLIPGRHLQIAASDDNLSLSHASEAVSTSCKSRREWRQLSSTEQQEYISAVLCLRDQPSKLSASSKHSSYDDFPWIHSHVGYYTHNSAPFLPWHRYFLHLYETTLREKCGYKGSLTYWDWTIDSEALERSPVFDPITGFGGDGVVDGNITVGRTGRCLHDGPFAGVNVSFYDTKFQPHCLSRGFRDQEGNLGHIDGHDISPASIDEVLALDKYADFVALMESKVHDTIPFGIGGDFETFTAPYDPVFFLHHTQLDRLWWLWQGDGARMDQYGGNKQRHSIEMASLDDEISMQALAPSIKVSEMMNTESGLLCYVYE